MKLLSSDRLRPIQVKELRQGIRSKIFLGAVLTIVASTASAAPQCNDRDNVLDLLKNQYSEAQDAIGVANNGGLVEVLSTGDGDTWSIIITTPNGTSCLVAAGEGWRVFEQLAMEPEA